jgi:hypothetical protein
MARFLHRSDHGQGAAPSGGYAFLPEALTDNAAGQLTDAQRSMFTHAGWQMRLLPTITGDLRKGEVRWVEGGIRKTRPLDMSQSTTTSSTPKYALEVGGESFDVPSHTVWDAVPEVGYFRLYYLPRSRMAINLERLPDPPVDASDPQDVIRAAWQAVGAALRPGIRNRDLARKADSAAHADAMLRAAMTQGQSGADSTVETGTGSVTEAGLVGTWRSVFVTVDVRPDGTLTLTAATQPPQTGRWHLDSAARLHLLLDGAAQTEEMITTVSLAGSRLNVELFGQTITLERAG